MCWRIKKWYFEKMDDYSEEEIAYRKERAARRWKAIEPKLRSLMAFYQIASKVERIYEVELPAAVKQLLNSLSVSFGLGISYTSTPLECVASQLQNLGPPPDRL